MSNLQPDQELPLTLRADRQLSLSPGAAARPSTVAQPRPDRPLQAQSGPSTPGFGVGVLRDQATALGLGMTGVALVTGFGWFLERRRRLAGSNAANAPATAPATATATDPVNATAPDSANAAEPPKAVNAATASDASEAGNGVALDAAPDVALNVATNAAKEAEASGYGYAPVPTRSRNTSAFLSVSRRKRLISLLMRLRSVSGAIAILAAIAVVVFWLIESTELGPSDMGLTWNLLIVLFATWVGHWGFGWLANELHRATFNRVHPKFDT